MGQTVLANTSPDGHDAINKMLETLQQEWGGLISKIVDTKVDIFIFLAFIRVLRIHSI